MSSETKTLSWIFIILCFVMISHIIAGVFYQFMPMSRWIEYYSVTPALPVFPKNQVLTFISDLDIKKKSNLEFNDILYCKSKGGEFARYSSQTTKTYAAPPIGRHTTTWPYSPGVASNKTCYLKSVIVLKLPQGYTKTQIITGPEFEVR